MEHYDLLIVGGGAAGISAAKAARRAGCASIAAFCCNAPTGALETAVPGRNLSGSF